MTWVTWPNFYIFFATTHFHTKRDIDLKLNKRYRGTLVFLYIYIIGRQKICMKVFLENLKIFDNANVPQSLLFMSKIFKSITLFVWTWVTWPNFYIFSATTHFHMNRDIDHLKLTEIKSKVRRNTCFFKYSYNEQTDSNRSLFSCGRELFEKMTSNLFALPISHINTSISGNIHYTC